MVDEYKFPIIPDRPYVIYNTAMTIDGKIATISGDSSLSDKEDWYEVHKIRKNVDGIMVGIGTILEDDAKLTVQYYTDLDHYPHRIVVDSHLRIPLNARVIQEKKDKYSTIIATVNHQASNKQKYKTQLLKEGVSIIETPSKNHVDLKFLLARLKERGIMALLLEGGGTLAWGMLKANLIDELRIFIAPILSGGVTATNLIMGKGFPTISDSPHFSLISVKSRKNFVILRYHRKE